MILTGEARYLATFQQVTVRGGPILTADPQRKSLDPFKEFNILDQVGIPNLGSVLKVGENKGFIKFQHQTGVTMVELSIHKPN